MTNQAIKVSMGTVSVCDQYKSNHCLLTAGSHSPAKKPRLGTDGTTQTDEMDSQQHSDTYEQECPTQEHTTGIVVDDAHPNIIATNTPVTASASSGAYEPSKQNATVANTPVAASVSQRDYEPSKQNATVANTPVAASVSSGVYEGGVTTSEPMDTLIQPKTENETLQSSSTTMESSDQSRVEKYAVLQTPRGYQKELAQPGIRGENYIICLPTGTGKTLVASMIVADHLKRRMDEEQQGKVLFIVPTQHLAHQQKEKLEECVNGITAVAVTGGTDETVIHPLLSQVDAIVCTPGKLRHELYRKKIKMSQFSLIVLDECHHAAGPASHYGDVMEFYLMEKLSQLTTSSTHSMPQVIGMTASPGAGKNRSPNLQKTIEHQIALCARIDATSGIKTNDSEELRKYDNQPLCLMNVIERRKSDEPFIRLVTSTMERLERALLQGGGPPHEKGSFKYKQWAKGEITAAQLRSENQRDQIAILEHLAEFSLALTTYEDFRFEDAMEIIAVTSQIPQDTATPMEQFIDQVRANLCQGLKGLPKIPNPILDAVEQLLLTQFHDSPESQGIFFVRAIKHTQFVSKWVAQSPRLSELVRVSAITGHTRAGMSKSEQNRIMEAFRKGEYNLLVSTAVLHEGIDVPACNFVIRFQHITNEIAGIQARGRARADNSKMYTVMSTSSPMQYNQLLQDEKEKLANLAIPLVSLVNLSDMLLKTQNKIIHKRRQKELAAQLHRKRWNASEVELLCNKCKTVACKGSDVFTYGVGAESHYVVPDIEFEEQFVKRVHTKPDATCSMVKLYKIACKKCNNDWGIFARWTKQGVLTFPVLKCHQFTFQCRGKMESFKQWKLVPFQVPLFDTDSDEEETPSRAS